MHQRSILLVIAVTLLAACTAAANGDHTRTLKMSSPDLARANDAVSSKVRLLRSAEVEDDKADNEERGPPSFTSVINSGAGINGAVRKPEAFTTTYRKGQKPVAMQYKVGEEPIEKYIRVEELQRQEKQVRMNLLRTDPSSPEEARVMQKLKLLVDEPDIVKAFQKYKDWYVKDQTMERIRNDLDIERLQIKYLGDEIPTLKDRTVKDIQVDLKSLRSQEEVRGGYAKRIAKLEDELDALDAKLEATIKANLVALRKEMKETTNTLAYYSLKVDIDQLTRDFEIAKHVETYKKFLKIVEGKMPKTAT